MRWLYKATTSFYFLETTKTSMKVKCQSSFDETGRTGVEQQWPVSARWPTPPQNLHNKSICHNRGCKRIGRWCRDSVCSERQKEGEDRRRLNSIATMFCVYLLLLFCWVVNKSCFLCLDSLTLRSLALNIVGLYIIMYVYTVEVYSHFTFVVIRRAAQFVQVNLNNSVVLFPPSNYFQ